MKAKYNGICKVTGRKIIAGVTEIEKVNGVWQAKGDQPQVDMDSTEQAIVALMNENMILVTDSKGKSYQYPPKNFLQSYRQNKMKYAEMGITFSVSRRPRINSKGKDDLDHQFFNVDA